jgi:threonyl-tRNA synthetase
MYRLRPVPNLEETPTPASRPATVTDRVVVVPGGKTCAEAVAAAKLPVAGPNAIVVVRELDGTLDLDWVAEVDVEIEPVAMSSPDGLDVLRHSTAHVLAQAVQDVYPAAKLGIGPPHDQVRDQFLEVMRMHDDYYRALGITDFSMVLAMRDPANKDKYHDDDEMWTTAERIAREAMEESQIFYIEEVGRGAYYGPKVDFLIRAVTGKNFAASTNQVDLYTPHRFGLTYHDSDGTEKPVVVIHRAPLGSHERFVAYLTEHFSESFPVWLAPERARIIPIVDDLLDYANKVRDTLLDADLRADVDTSDGRLPAKVRAAITGKIPLIVVLGRREAEQRAVTIRYRSGQEIPMPLDDFVKHARELVRSKSLEDARHLQRDIKERPRTTEDDSANRFDLE